MKHLRRKFLFLISTGKCNCPQLQNSAHRQVEVVCGQSIQLWGAPWSPGASLDLLDRNPHWDFAVAPIVASCVQGGPEFLPSSTKQSSTRQEPALSWSPSAGPEMPHCWTQVNTCAVCCCYSPGAARTCLQHVQEIRLQITHTAH